ncbi:hypothetical protein GXW82_25250 [Streptacidiphilus sp. 4-A2]|nr:hypothetical protein [Streptacidiphilus sp. 4-A2]
MQRLEVLKSTPSMLLRAGAVDPGRSEDSTRCPSHTVDRTTAPSRAARPVHRQGPVPGRAHYAAADFRQMSSLDWDDYQVDATVSGLSDGTNQASISVRDDSAEPIVVGISRGTLSISRDNIKLAEKKIADVSRHTVEVTVQGPVTTARVDGTAVLSWTSKVTSPTQLTGGFGIRVGINRPGVAWPVFDKVSVSEAAPAVRPGGPDALPVSEAVLLDPTPAGGRARPDRAVPDHLAGTGAAVFGQPLRLRRLPARAHRRLDRLHGQRHGLPAQQHRGQRGGVGARRQPAGDQRPDLPGPA